MTKDSKIYIAGHRGLVGSAILQRLQTDGYLNVITKTHQELDLTRQADTEAFFKKEMREYIFLSAAKVGGIYANSTYPAQFIYENLAIQTNVIHSAYLCGVKKLLFLGSACSYPRECPQPMKEEYLLSGYLEPTNEPYAVAKIAGIKMSQAYKKQYGINFICAIPTNIYGPNDNFNSENSHVISALIKKIHETKEKGMQSVTIWGTGKPMREFIYVDDVADASVFLMKHYDGSEIINIGSGEEISIRELAFCIKEIVRFEGDIIFDTSKPDGSPRKSLDITRLKKVGWQAKTPLRDGLKKTYEWYLKHTNKCIQ
ncbi:MAG TPA: GDP-L-fucose synthase family protein [Candidatus Brocadiaceae bacterium]